MFKFLFGRKGGGTITKETQRQTVERALVEINEIVAAMTEKPRITVDMASGQLAVDLPEQMPDEALALPAPEAEAAETPEPEVNPDAEDEAGKEAA